MSEPRSSQHPVDRLIRQITIGTHAPTESDIEQIIEQIATVPFDPRVKPMPSHLVKHDIGAQSHGVGAPSIVVHLLTRIHVDRQWSRDTSVDDYLADLRAAVRHDRARVGLYIRRSGHIVAVIAPTEHIVPPWRRGKTTLPHLMVLYSADRSIIVSGYQFSAMTEVAIPEDVLWLK